MSRENEIQSRWIPFLFCCQGEKDSRRHQNLIYISPYSGLHLKEYEARHSFNIRASLPDVIRFGDEIEFLSAAEFSGTLDIRWFFNVSAC